MGAIDMTDRIRTITRRYGVSMPLAETGFFALLIGALWLFG